MDESSVEILHIVSGPDSMAHNSHVDSYRYPKAGMRPFFFFFPLQQRNEPISTSCAPGWALSLNVHTCNGACAHPQNMPHGMR